MKALSFDDIQLVPRYNNIISRKDADTSVQFGKLKLNIPIFSSNMDTITGPVMAHKMYQLGGLGFLHRFCSIEENVNMYIQACFVHQQGLLTPFGDTSCLERKAEAVISLGVNEGLDRFSALYERGARYFCVDVAHGHSRSVGRLIKQIKEFDEQVFVIAGNVCTAEGAEYLADKGADAIKVGIGPGSVCSTRIKTGFGVPQFSAISECRHVTILVIADGGIKTPGDAVKAFAAGADAVMLGGMLSGTDETPGDAFVDEQWGAYKMFRGMASKEAQDEFMGSMNEWKTSEGVTLKVKAKGPVTNVVTDVMGGIRSGMTYCGANNIRQMRERARWVEITTAGMAEGQPHGRNWL